MDLRYYSPPFFNCKKLKLQRRAKDTSLFPPCEALLLLAYSEWTFDYFQQLIMFLGYNQR